MNRPVIEQFRKHKGMAAKGGAATHPAIITLERSR